MDMLIELLIEIKSLLMQKNIYMDKQSGKDFNRPQYKKLLKKFTAHSCILEGPVL